MSFLYGTGWCLGSSFPIVPSSYHFTDFYEHLMIKLSFVIHVEALRHTISTEYPFFQSLDDGLGIQITDRNSFDPMSETIMNGEDIPMLSFRDSQRSYKVKRHFLERIPYSLFHLSLLDFLPTGETIIDIVFYCLDDVGIVK